jgi:predicted patatin/cPLA2 family phospholipase
MYRGFVKLDGRLVADGGVASPIPVKEAYQRGARSIVVIRTRAANQSKGWFIDSLLAMLFLRGHPVFSSQIRRLHRVYQDAVQFIHNPPGDARIFEITPPFRLRSTRIRSRLEFLKADYEMGRQVGSQFVMKSRLFQMEHITK